MSTRLFKEDYISSLGCRELFECISDKVNKELQERTEYYSKNNKYLELIGEISDLLPSDKKHLISILYEANNDASRVYSEELFIQGIRFGVHITHLIEPQS